MATHGIDHELSSVALTIARDGMTAGMRVVLFLTRSGVDIARRRAADSTHGRPLDPLADLSATSCAGEGRSGPAQRA